MEAIRKSVRLRRPEECAGAIIFFASTNTSRYIKAQMMDINGG
jgi:hypothetical protein